MGFFSNLFRRDFGLGTGLVVNGSGDTVATPAPDAKPQPGEQTQQQAIATSGIAMGQLPGFLPPDPGTYLTYRKMSGHPTLALVKSIVTAPVLAAAWSFEVRRPDGQRVKRAPAIGDGVGADPLDKQLTERSAFYQRMLEPMRLSFLTEALRALEFGWRPFEKVFSIDARKYRLTKLKSLLPEFTYVLVDVYGSFAGLTQMSAQLGPEKCLVYSYDAESGHLYGRSRHENARETWCNWHQIDRRGAQLATKVASIVSQVHYPLGQSKDASGNLRDNSDLADKVLEGLTSGRGVKLPNMFAQGDDPRLSAELAGKSAWVISFLEAASAASQMTGLTERQRYYDALMFRAWLRSERVGIEATTAGSRADSAEHTDTAITDSELIHHQLCELLNRDVLDQLLVLNENDPNAAGSVYVTPSPLQDAKKALLAKLFETAWQNPNALGAFLERTDMDAVYDLVEMPKSTDGVTFSATDVAAPKPIAKPPPDDANSPRQSGDKPAKGKGNGVGKMLSRWVAGENQ